MCGIFGILQQETNVSLDIYEALTMLQHRGQDAAGIVTLSGNYFYEKKGKGLVKDVFSQKNIESLKGSAGLGHVRYPTAGSLSIVNAQPFYVNAPFGMHMVHNGNLTNTTELRKKVQTKYKRHLRTDSDTEVLLNVFANALYKKVKENPERDNKENVFDAIEMTMERVEGAYSVLVLIDQIGLLAFRDPCGIRPLVLGKKKKTISTKKLLGSGEGVGSFAFASEDVAFAPIDFEKLRDVAPGEAVLVTLDGAVHTRQCKEGTLTPCIFEFIYLARPDSMISDISVYKTQLRFGEALAKQIKKSNLKIDAVIPVPDSSRPVALEIATNLNLKYREGLVKNRYVGRTFIMPDQDTRESSVRRKLNAIPLEFEGKNVLLVDDSIVRGTTSKRIVKMCRSAGAKEVYLASAAPPVRYPNVYGVDIPTRSELVAHNRSIEEVKNELGCDALFYQTLEDTVAAAREGNPEIKNFEASVFDGKYVTGNITEEYLKELETNRSRI